MQFAATLTALCISAGLVLADSTFTPARPPSIPIAVRSPYLSTWQQAGSNDGDGGYLAGRWFDFWSSAPGNGRQINAMTGIIRVDGIAYEFMGFPSERVTSLNTTINQTSFEYTSTRSIFTQSVGPVQVVTTFLSPIAVDDQMRNSLVSSYVNVAVASTDGNEHQVELYTDVSAEWASGYADAIAEWSYDTTGDAAYHKFYRQTPLEFSENDSDAEKAEWGNWYWTGASDGVSHQSGGDIDVRSQFAQNGSLTNAEDTNYRAINDNYPVFAFSYDLGNVGSTSVSKVFTIGLYQANAIQFEGADGVVSLPSLWTSYWSDETQAVSFFFDDYSQASSAADTWDQRIQSDSVKAGGQNYATITTLAARQAFGGVQLVGNATKQYVFLKEISSDGNVQTVDVIYPAIPIFLYSNATYMKLLLDPLFENQEAGNYPNAWAVHDLGSHYPNATGHNDGNDEHMPLEESGNMLVMTYAYYIKSQDADYLKQHYTILKQWTGYLVEYALNQTNQLTTDDFAGALTNSTNLAYKATIGIEAAAQIANLTGNTADYQNFSSIASKYIDELNTLAFDSPTNPTKALLKFGNQGSWLTLYNLYADKLLKTNIVPQKVFDVQNAYYPTKYQPYGLPLDSRGLQSKADWLMFAAAAASDDVKADLIAQEAKFIAETPSAEAFTDWYNCTTGGDISGTPFRARPVIGGTFALLAL